MKPLKLSFSPRAAIDLEEIGDYIARDNPRRALSFLDELEEECGRIKLRPPAFRNGTICSQESGWQFMEIT
jgi:toxin ParE1/3/4